MDYTIGVSNRHKGVYNPASREALTVKRKAIQSRHKGCRSRFYNIEMGVRENNIQEAAHVRESCTVVQAESTVDEWFYIDGHLDAFFAFAFDHTSHGDRGHPQYRLSFGES